MITNEVTQANYLYSCAAFRTFSPGFKAFLGNVNGSYSTQDDLYQYMVENLASTSLIEQFNSVIVHRADNKDFFEWSVVRNGLLMPSPQSEVDPAVTPLSERTPQVRDAIATEARLAQFYSLVLSSKNITSLKAGDFDGLTSLTTLSLYDDQLATLPEGIFDGLTSLTTLSLYDDQLATLPEGIFDGLTSLTTLSLYGNQLATLPAGVFDGLTPLTTLSLWGNRLTTLPEGIFNGLTSLTTLNLGNNWLSALPERLFDGLTELTSIHLYGNTTNPLPVAVSLEKVGEGRFKASAHTGTPFNIVLALSVTNGTIIGGASSVRISTGSVESPTLSATRTPGTTAAVTVDIGSLPGLPADVNRFNVLLHQGYTLVKSGDSPLEVIAAAPTQATDFNGDGRTDFADFFLFADAYGGTDAKFDLDGNGTVDFADFFKFVDAFGS